MFSGITHVFLDVDNTLLDFEAGAKEASFLALSRAGIDAERFDYAVFTEENNALWAALERGEITREDIHRTRWERVFSRLGIEADGEAFEPVFLSAIPECVVQVDGAREILEYLSARYTVCAASNAPHAQQLSRLKSAGLLHFFEDVFTSERLGAAKPSKAFFDGVFGALPAVSPSSCVMVGDSLTADVGGAAAYGLKTVFFDFKGQNPAFCPADERIWSLSELKLFL